MPVVLMNHNEIDYLQELLQADDNPRAAVLYHRLQICKEKQPQKKKISL